MVTRTLSSGEQVAVGVLAQNRQGVFFQYYKCAYKCASVSFNKVGILADSSGEMYESCSLLNKNYSNHARSGDKSISSSFFRFEGSSS